MFPIFHSSLKHKQMLLRKIFTIDQVFENDKSCLNPADNEKGNVEGWGRRKIELESEPWKALHYSKELPVSCSPSRLLYRKLEAYGENFVGGKEAFYFRGISLGKFIIKNKRLGCFTSLEIKYISDDADKDDSWCGV